MKSRDNGPSPYWAWHIVALALLAWCIVVIAIILSAML